MVSKNNTIKRLQENSEQRPHFAIRKLSIGAASVLIGLSFLGVNHRIVKADTNSDNNGENGDAASGDVNKSTQTISSVPDKVVVEANLSSFASSKETKVASQQVNAQVKRMNKLIISKKTFLIMLVRI